MAAASTAAVSSLAGTGEGLVAMVASYTQRQEARFAQLNANHAETIAKHEEVVSSLRALVEIERKREQCAGHRVV